MAGRIILVRHGETEANRAGVFAESDEIPLTESGRGQARAAARRLAASPPHRLYSSPLVRARETGEILALELGMEVEILQGIHERDFGCLKGHPYRRMGEMMAADPSCDFARSWLWRPAGGESLEDVRERVIAVLRNLWKKHAGLDLMVVCHGAVIQAISAHLSGDWENAAVPANCESLAIDGAVFGERV
ncbi:MAG TPA: histidine phosphatase family protein [Bryobacteraceae bacterium]|jgi:probable phosphoglycerate mutase|nr:histidine phosphatase family protein [Bryobacteraceae bacterium]